MVHKVSCSENIIIEFLIIDIRHVYPGDSSSCFLGLFSISVYGMVPKVYHLSLSPFLESSHNFVQRISLGFIFD